MRVYLHLLSACLALAGLPAAAQTLPGDPVEGRILANRVCAGCHLVSDRQIQAPVDGVPSFASIAREPSVTAIGLRAFLQTPHPPMPDLHLAQRETDDVISYILSLRRFP